MHKYFPIPSSYNLKKLIPTTNNSLNMHIIHITIMPHQLSWSCISIIAI